MQSYENIPAEIKSLPQWVCWRFEMNPKRPEKPKKVPISALTGGRAESNNANTWASYDACVRAVETSGGLLHGIGFMFGSGYFGVDIDGVDDEIAAWQEGANSGIIAEFVYSLGSYAEYSVSGKGIHILCRGHLPPSGRHVDNIEMYESGRFFTVTGYIASEYTEIVDCTETIKPLHEKYIQGGRTPTAYPRPVADDLNVTAADVMRIAENSKQGAMFSALYRGEWDKLFTSQSEADLSFCNMLAFYCRRDEALMDDIFRSSGLMREKWDRAQSGSTYGAITISKAARECATVYSSGGGNGYSVSFSGKPRDKRRPDFTRYTLDDTGNAARMADMFGEVVRYCYPEKRWYYYDGRRWCMDRTGAMRRMADDVTIAIREDHDAFVDAMADKEGTDADELSKLYMKHVKRCRANATKSALLDETQAHVPVLPEEMDVHSYLLNTPSGIVDLKKGTMSSHDPDKLITKLTVAEYTERSDCPRWEQFLSEIFDGDAELIRFVQKAVGYSLTGSTDEQCMFFAVGDGNNGKSTFFETIAAVMGDYAANVQPKTLLARQNASEISSDIARLKGHRFVTVPEPAEGARLDEGLVKQLTGGNRVTARKLYADEMEFTPEFKIWLETNHKPVIRGTDFGIWRRMRIIPFNVKIPEDKIDRNLRFKLAAEYPAILRWAVDGAALWQSEGLSPPPCVAQAVAEYKNEMDVLSAFLAECTSPGGEAAAGELYKAYVAWARETNEHVMSATKFGREVAKKYDKVKTPRGLVVNGITINRDYQAYTVHIGQKVIDGGWRR